MGRRDFAWCRDVASVLPRPATTPGRVIVRKRPDGRRFGRGSARRVRRGYHGTVIAGICRCRLPRRSVIAPRRKRLWKRRRPSRHPPRFLEFSRLRPRCRSPRFRRSGPREGSIPPGCGKTALSVTFRSRSILVFADITDQNRAGRAGRLPSRFRIKNMVRTDCLPCSFLCAERFSCKDALSAKKVILSRRKDLLRKGFFAPLRMTRNSG